jgi:hypothetical protein
MHRRFQGGVFNALTTLAEVRADPHNEPNGEGGQDSETEENRKPTYNEVNELGGEIAHARCAV